jgi:hypothetical protein
MDFGLFVEGPLPSSSMPLQKMAEVKVTDVSLSLYQSVAFSYPFTRPFQRGRFTQRFGMSSMPA